VGEHLRTQGVSLPGRQSLGEFVEAYPDLLTLSGPPNSRKVSVAGRSTADAMAASVCAELDAHGDMTTTELKLRLSEQGRFVPGLATLLRRRNDTFSVASGVVSLRHSASTQASLAAASPVAPLLRLLSLGISSSMDDQLLQAASTASEIIAIDMDNKAFVLERAVQKATRQPQVLVLAFCGRTHNPRVAAPAAEAMRALSGSGRLRLVMPARDTKNAADFVMSFWAGWLHARTPPTAQFVLVSTDIHLEQTVRDVLRLEGREVLDTF